MEETLISFELALTKSKKGFNHIEPNCYGDVMCYQLPEGELIPSSKANVVAGYVLAPTQSLLAKWLRENNIFVTVTNQINVADDEKATEFILFDWEIKYLSSDTNKFEEEVNYFEWFNTYEEALEDALGEALNYIE